MCTLKGYVRNKARIEGSISEGYVNEECAIFCARYMKDTTTKLHRRERVLYLIDEVGVDKYYSVFQQNGMSMRKGKMKELSTIELAQLENYILKNCDEISSFIEYVH